MQIPDNIANCPAVLAAILGPAGTHTPHLELSGDGSWHDMLKGLLLLMGNTREPFIRLVVGDYTLVVQREGEVLIGVAFKTGPRTCRDLRCRRTGPISKSASSANSRGKSLTRRDIAHSTTAASPA